MYKTILTVSVLTLLNACSGDYRLSSSRTFRSVEPTREPENATEDAEKETGESYSGLLLQCSDVQMTDSDKGVAFCSVMRDGKKMNIPTDAKLDWKLRGSEELGFLFTKLGPQISQHVVVQLWSMNGQFMSDLSGATISAKVDGQYLESRTLNVKTDDSTP